jgi:signal transduction histidine kinase
MIDDDSDDWLLARSALTESAPGRYEMQWASNYQDGLEQLVGGGHDVCLLDYRLGAEDGLSLLRERDKVGGRTPVIMLTGVGDVDVDRVAVQSGAADYLVKGKLDGELLDRSIRYALARREGEDRAVELARAQAAQSVAESHRAQLRQLLATISHDLQQPLTAIRGRADITKRRVSKTDNADPQLIDALQEISANAMRMSDQLRELVEATRQEAAQELTLATGPVDLTELVRAVIEDARQGWGDSHALELSEPSTAVVGDWDAPKLRRVIENLLNNAVKYSDAGSTVTVRIEPEAGDLLALSVADQGRGIPPEDLAHVFQAFRRGSNVGTTSGTGLGLASVREIVERHGGTITAESELGRGSTFSVRLPRTAAAAS